MKRKNESLKAVGERELHFNGVKGITLVALIITVIILLILATVSISLIINSGILDHTQHGVDRYSEEEELEQIKLAVSAAQLAGEGFLNTSNLNEELQSIFNDSKEVKTIQNYWNYKGYKIDKNGNVERNILPKEYQQVEYIESTGTQWINTKLLAGNYIDLSVKIEGNYTYIPNTYEFIFGANANSGPWVFIGYFKSRNSFLVQCR